MANTLKKYETRLKASVAAVAADDIKEVLVDYLSNVNAEHDYPLLLATPPQATAKGSILEYEELDCEIWVYVPEHLRNGLSWLEICDENKGFLRKVLKDMFERNRPDCVLIGDVVFTQGHFMHNAMLAGSKAKFKMRVYYGC